jgi:CRP/FNR family transcriptional regulator, cyclic AMP receptor protein
MARPRRRHQPGAHPPHAEIASRISTHREAVTRELSRLEDLGLIAREGRKLRVTDLARLTAMVEDATPE